jgi:hypothetical protein
MPGLALSRALYEEIVAPALARTLPGLRYAAGLFGAGSDVLGYDTARSMDHDWGPRCVLVLDATDAEDVRPRLQAILSDAMPEYFLGFPATFQDVPGEPGVTVPAGRGQAGPRRHRVEITTVEDVRAGLDYAPGDETDPAFWLAVSDQRLLEVTAGEMFRDDTGNLIRLRSTLAFYPDDVWRYRMAALWMRISQIEPFIGRTGELGDETGSFVIAARLVEDVIRLAISQARRYAPYAKWLGTAFSRLPVAADLQPHLDAVRQAPDWRHREAGIVAATSVLAHAHNRLGVTPEIDPSPRPFHSRPFMVIGGERVAQALGESLRGTALHGLPVGVGGIDQFVDSTDALISRWLRQQVRQAIGERLHQT